MSQQLPDAQSTRVLQRDRLSRPLLDRLQDLVRVEEPLHFVLLYPALRLARRHVTARDEEHAHERDVPAAERERERAVATARARREVSGDGDACVDVGVGAKEHGDDTMLVGLVLGEDHAQCHGERLEPRTTALVRVGAATKEFSHDADAGLGRGRDHRRQTDEAHDVRVLACSQQDVHAVVVALERGEAQRRAVQSVQTGAVAAGVDEHLEGGRHVTDKRLHERRVTGVVLDLRVGTDTHQDLNDGVGSDLRCPVQGRLTVSILQGVRHNG